MFPLSVSVSDVKIAAMSKNNSQSKAKSKLLSDRIRDEVSNLIYVVSVVSAQKNPPQSEWQAVNRQMRTVYALLDEEATQLRRILLGVQNNENIFSISGNVMTIQFKGKVAALSIAKHLGLRYIREIVKNGCENDGLTPMELIDRIRPEMLTIGNNRDIETASLAGVSTEKDRNKVDVKDQSESNKLYDDPRTKEVLWVKQQELNDAEKQGWHEDAKEVRELFRGLGIVKVVKSADGTISIRRRLNRQSGKVPIDETKERCRTAVAQRIVAAKREIKKSLPALLIHLDTFMVSRGMKWRYDPKPPMKWLT